MRKRTGAERAFMLWALRKILSEMARTGGHPLAFLVNPDTQNWKARRHADEHHPAVQAGHLTSFKSGAEERLALEDADRNQLKNWTVENKSRGGIAMSNAVEIGGIPVDLATAMAWERLELLPKGTVGAANAHPGWARAGGPDEAT
jgi:hypothetical protein